MGNLWIVTMGNHWTWGNHGNITRIMGFSQNLYVIWENIEHHFPVFGNHDWMGDSHAVLQLDVAG